MTYPWGDNRRYNSYSGYFRKIFGERVQKITVNAGFTCPNRDGTLSTGGCTFCSNDAFTPSYCMKGRDIEWQIREGIEFHRNRYRTASRYLVYFQSFSNTYADLDLLRSIYDRALAFDEVAGVVVGTRPDCVDGPVLDYFADLARDKYVAIEYGVESVHDKTLIEINRGHDFECARKAVNDTSSKGIHVGAHFILGLPGETDRMLIDQVDVINSLPLDTIKFHQLQLFQDTAMAREYVSCPEKFRFWTLDQYLELFTQILRRLRPDLVVERFAGEAPPRYHAGPSWGMVRNERLWQLLEQKLNFYNAHQGDLYKGNR